MNKEQDKYICFRLLLGVLVCAASSNHLVFACWSAAQLFLCLVVFLFFERVSRVQKVVWCAGTSSVRSEIKGEPIHCTMAAGCCGTKKQKLNNSSSVPSCNNGSTAPTSHQLLETTNGINKALGGMVALPEMCFFCFDVLYCHLYNLAPPKTPSFSNDA